MNTYRITVAYDGTAYRGWQRQENTELTVQGILERRISEIAGKKTVVSGSGRTDSGVHALGQECSLYLEQEIDMDSFKKQLNALLPEDIRVLDISREKRDFHERVRSGNAMSIRSICVTRWKYFIGNTGFIFHIRPISLRWKKQQSI